MSESHLKFPFRILGVLLSVVAIYLLSWAWTSTTGIKHLKKDYFDDLKQNIKSDLNRRNVPMTVDQVLDEIGTSEYFQNPRSPCPFVIFVDTNYMYRSGEPLESGPGYTQMHVWFFGYVSDSL